MYKAKQAKQTNNLKLNNNTNRTHKIKVLIITIVGHNGPNTDKVINIQTTLKRTIIILC